MTNDRLGSVRDTAENIVCSLAALKPPLDESYWECALCGGDLRGPWERDELYTSLEAHESKCPWRRAREWAPSVTGKGRPRG